MKAHRLFQEQRARGRISFYAWVAIAGLLVLPVCSLIRQTHAIDWRLLFGVPLAASFFAFFAYRADKLRAEEGEWRVSESTLHLAEILGGWPGAFLAQRLFRHKTRKVSYQTVFWTIVVAHQFLAIDSFSQWRCVRQVYHFMQSLNA